ncbi:MAG: hypothetical protein ACPG47_10760, partial [Leucothrix sp.]
MTQRSQQLPDEISAWASVLRAFPDDLRTPLEQMGNVLSKVIKLLPHQETAGQFEPNGINGIHSRVNYERLLTSEWAIYHSYPEEFIRRAAFGEHQFYKLSHLERKHDEAVYALFDCGPEQLGRPRIVQLALLILLIRYAETLHATLHWGVLQDNSNQWYKGVNPQLIEQWLQQPSADLLDKAQLQERLDALDKDLANQQKIWCITPEPLDEFPQLIPIAIENDLFDSRKMTVSVGSLNRQCSQVLQLPNDQICNQIISDPFKKIKKPAVLEKPWHLNYSGAFLIILNASRYLKSYKAGAHRPRVQLAIPEKAHLLGVFANKRTTAVLTEVDDEYILQGFPSAFKHRRYQKSHRVKAASDLPPMVVITQSTSVLLLDHKHNLRCLRFSDGYCKSETIAQSVYALGNDGNYIYYIIFDPAKRSLVLHWASTDQHNFQSTEQKTLLNQMPFNVPELFIDHHHWSRRHAGIIAIKALESQWHINIPYQEAP